MARTRANILVEGERGFGIAEVLVAMFLLGIIAVSVIPILVQGLRQSTTNAVLATATQLANQQVEQIRPLTSCAAVTAATVNVTAQGIPLQSSRTVATCPLVGYPTTLAVTVTVKRTDTNAVMASARTLAFVTGP